MTSKPGLQKILTEILRGMNQDGKLLIDSTKLVAPRVVDLAILLRKNGGGARYIDRSYL
jgi:hypothetical protein